MCHTIHYADRDKTELCEDGKLGKRCKLTEEWRDSARPSRKHILTRIDTSRVETSASLADRLPTPYAHPLPAPKSPNAPGVYVNGTKVADISKPRKPRDDYDYHYRHRSSRHVDPDPRDRDDERRDRRSRLDDRDLASKPKRSSTLPQYVVIEQEKPRRRTSRDDYEGPTDLTKEYIRRRRSSRERERSRSRERDAGLYYRKHTTDGYVIVDDDKERRQQRRERRRSIDGYTSDQAVYSSTAAFRYTPRRTSTIIHRSDGTTLDKRTDSPPKEKQIRWADDEKRDTRRTRDSRDPSRERSVRVIQNAEIASRPKLRSDPDRDPRLKSILKKPEPKIDNPKYRDEYRDEVEELRRAVQDMDIPRGRNRKPQEWDEQVERLRSRLGDDDHGDRRKRTKVWRSDDRYEYL